MDNIGPLRELADRENSETVLFSPPDAYRVRWNMFSDTPLPPEEPAGENPPDGAILDYYLGDDRSEVKLTIKNTRGDVIRVYSSNDPLEMVDTTALPHPTYWIRPKVRPETTKGHHRFVWDLRYTPPPGSRRQFSIAAVHQRTPSGPHGPYVPPGEYKVVLQAGGVEIEKTITVKMDPRVTASREDIALQSALSFRCYQGYLNLQELKEEINERLASSKLKSNKREALTKLRGSGAAGDPDILYGSIYEQGADEETIVGLQHKLLFMQNLLQGADERPTKQAAQAVVKLEELINVLKSRYEKMK